MSKCEACGGSGFIRGRSKTLDGVEYPFVERCGACSNPATMPEPGFAKPVSKKAARSNNPKNRDLGADTADWLRTHPLTAARFLMYARELAAAKRRFGIGMITERIRYEATLEGWSPEDYKINNNFRAYIARWIIQQDPSIEPFMEFRDTRWGPA